MVAVDWAFSDGLFSKLWALFGCIGLYRPYRGHMGLYRGYIGEHNCLSRVSQNHGLFLVIYSSTAPLRVPKRDPNFANCPNRAPNRRPKSLNFWLGMAYTSKIFPRNISQ